MQKSLQSVFSIVIVVCNSTHFGPSPVFRLHVLLPSTVDSIVPTLFLCSFAAPTPTSLGLQWPLLTTRGG